MTTHRIRTRLPFGITQNNPLHVLKDNDKQLLGEIPRMPGKYCWFRSPDHGIMAGTRMLYAQHVLSRTATPHQAMRYVKKEIDKLNGTAKSYGKDVWYTDDVLFRGVCAGMPTPDCD